MNEDTLSLILYECNPRFIIECSLVSKLWQTTIKHLTETQWKVIYNNHTGLHVDVGPNFDWKKAAVSLCTNEPSVIAKWNTKRIQIISPCTRTGFKVGVVPVIDTVIDTRGRCLDYIYDDAFCLRAIRQTCKKRQSDKHCTNCQNPRAKRSCLTPAYSYHIHNHGLIDQKKINEFILFRVRI